MQKSRLSKLARKGVSLNKVIRFKTLWSIRNGSENINRWLLTLTITRKTFQRTVAHQNR
jgi:hypothetical protein